MDVLVREHVADDLPAMKRITVDSFADVSIDRALEDECGLVNGHDWRWRKARHIDEDVARPEARAFVAELDGQVVGYITTWIDRDAGVGFIPNLAVDSASRGGGIGRRLVEHALDWFRTCMIQCVRIETLEQNAIGRRLYPDCGFREIARQIHFAIQLDDTNPSESARD